MGAAYQRESFINIKYFQTDYRGIKNGRLLSIAKQRVIRDSSGGGDSELAPY